MKNRICDGMIKFIPKVTPKNNKELKPKWINNKVKPCLKKKHTYFRKYLSYSRHNHTTDGVTCGKHHEEIVKHRNISNSEKIKSRKQYEMNIAHKCKTDHNFLGKYVNTSLKVTSGIRKLVVVNCNAAETDEKNHKH